MDLMGITWCMCAQAVQWKEWQDGFAVCTCLMLPSEHVCLP